MGAQPKLNNKVVNPSPITHNQGTHEGCPYGARYHASETTQPSVPPCKKRGRTIKYDLFFCNR